MWLNVARHRLYLKNTGGNPKLRWEKETYKRGIGMNNRPTGNIKYSPTLSDINLSPHTQVPATSVPIAPYKMGSVQKIFTKNVKRQDI